MTSARKSRRILVEHDLCVAFGRVYTDSYQTHIHTGGRKRLRQRRKEFKKLKTKQHLDWEMRTGKTVRLFYQEELKNFSVI